jgi:hypothetical protein
LKADKEVVLAAVSQAGISLEYASPELKADKEVVLVAVSQDGNAIYSANPALKGDPEILWHASKKGFRANEPENALIQQYDALRKETAMQLFAKKPPPANEDAARKQAAWRRLHANGPYFANQFKTRIANFAGVSKTNFAGVSKTNFADGSEGGKRRRTRRKRKTKRRT